MLEKAPVGLAGLRLLRARPMMKYFSKVRALDHVVQVVVIDVRHDREDHACPAQLFESGEAVLSEPKIIEHEDSLVLESLVEEFVIRRGIDNFAEAGKFKVPTLRNVAVTAPYMHNGIFRELETVVVFYNKFILTNAESQTNPETGEPWGEPEIPETVDLDLLKEGQPVSPLQIRPLVTFLETLTDRRYEHLLGERN